MEDREQEQRCRVAAWAIAYWGRIYLLCFVFHLVTVRGGLPASWWWPILTEVFQRRVRRGEELGHAFGLCLCGTIVAFVVFWGIVDGMIPGGPRSLGWYMSFAGAQIALGGVASWFTLQAWRHVPRPEPPERTLPQIRRHRQMAGLVALVGVMAVLALVTWGLVLWQETGRPSHPLKLIGFGGLVGLLTVLLVRAVRRGRGVTTATALLLPFLILGMTGTVVMLLLFPIGSQRWILALVFLLASTAATVVTMRAILGGEQKGQGSAGGRSRHRRQDGTSR